MDGCGGWQGHLAGMGGGDMLDVGPGLAKGDVENLLQERTEALEEARMELSDLEAKNRELLDKVRQLSLCVKTSHTFWKAYSVTMRVIFLSFSPIVVSVVCPTGPHPPLRLARQPNRGNIFLCIHIYIYIYV